MLGGERTYNVLAPKRTALEHISMQLHGELLFSIALKCCVTADLWKGYMLCDMAWNAWVCGYVIQVQYFLIG